VRLGRTPLVAGLLIGLALTSPGAATAEPRPTVKQAKAKLERLNNRADKVVDRFNTLNEEYKKAKTHHTRLDASYKRKLKTVEDLRATLVNMAVSDYKLGGDVSSWPGMFGNPDPGRTLGALALAGQMQAERAEKLTAFDRENKGLKVERDRAQEAFAVADGERDKVEKERAEILDLIKDQKKLLERLGAYNAGNPNSTGTTYTGPASGNARSAMQFAFAQTGKPYIYGGTGPRGYDCSGFTQASWRAAGVSLPRTTWQQWAWGAKRKVPLDQLKPGDLIFSQGLGHVTMYAGNGNIVHAPQTGDVIKVVKLSAYGRSIAGAIRP
jgi:peptidoglycan DL-endopeptidase CwlO